MFWILKFISDLENISGVKLGNHVLLDLVIVQFEWELEIWYANTRSFLLKTLCNQYKGQRTKRLVI